jgi:hypothetical protein
MTDHQTPPAYTPLRHHSTSCPAHRATYLHALLRTVDHLVHGSDEPGAVGLPALVALMVEMADDLCREIECLDERGWPIARAAVAANRAGK